MTDNGTTPPRGHVKVARKLFATHPFWLEEREFSRFEAWLDMIQLAAFKDGTYKTAHGVHQLARGEFVASLRWLADRWTWSVKRVRLWIQTAQNRAMLRAQRETQDGTVYLIVNYDAYQSTPRNKGTPNGKAPGTPRAHRGHKIEAVRSSRSKRSTTLSPSFDEQRVLDHYCATHPLRRTGDDEIKVTRKALELGYTADELIAAIDGNANDDWHAQKHKHELSYVLRNRDLIESFRAKVNGGPMVDPVTGAPTVAGMVALGIDR